MTIITVLVAMVAIGALAQRTGLVERYFGQKAVVLTLVPDEAIASSNVLARIDVLNNDLGLESRDAQSLAIFREPECGRAFVKAGRIEYLATDQCTGRQTFEYTVEGDTQQLGEVTVVVRGANPRPSASAGSAQRDGQMPSPIPMLAMTTRLAVPPPALQAQPAGVPDHESAADRLQSVPRPSLSKDAPALARAAVAPAQAVSVGAIVAGKEGFDGATKASRLATPASAPAAAVASPSAAPEPAAPEPAAAAPPAPQSPDAGPAGDAATALAGLNDAPVATVPEVIFAAPGAPLSVPQAPEAQAPEDQAPEDQAAAAEQAAPASAAATGGAAAPSASLPKPRSD